MELSSFSEHIVTEYFERDDGLRFEVKINIDAFVPEYFEVLDQRLEKLRVGLEPKKDKKGKVKTESALQLEKRLLEIQREAYAEMLTCPVKLPNGESTCLLKGWDLTENGLPLAASKEVLVMLPPNAVQELWEFCKERSKTVKKPATAALVSQTTGAITADGSQALRVVGGQGT